jgi:kinetochore protein Mis12/MTW1
VDNGSGAPQFATAEEAHQHEVENGTHQLETLLCASIDRNFDKFELYVMRNILVVRPEDRDWVRLAHYDSLVFPSSSSSPSSPAAGNDDDNARPTTESVNALRRKLQASQRLNALLHAEKSRGEAVLRGLRAAVGGGAGTQKEGAKAPLGFLRETGALADGDARTPLGTTAAFALSQLQALRALSTSLRSVMPDLAEGAERGAAEAGRAGWRKERLEYVEGAARKHLENVRGLELGKNGEVRDGEWQGEGRNLTKGEVEGLEKVVTILGPGPESSSKGDEMDES